MSQENVETLQRALDAFNRRDKASWLTAVEPDVENFPPSEWPESRPLRGAEAVWDFFVQSQEQWADGSFGWGEVVDAGPDKLVANQRRDLRGKTSGAAVDWSYWVVHTLRNGKVVRFQWFRERDQALRAAGLQE
jgi:ketosteroid isomerase-like protein